MRFILGCFLYLLWWGPALAAMSTQEMVPPALKPWTHWVLYEHEISPCPSLYNQIGQTRLCAWPAPLALSLTQQGGAFTQTWEVEQEGWIGLPGDKQYWPLDVTADGKPIAVSDHAGAPAVFLTPGRHALAGKFRWAQLPERLKVPETVALVQLRIEGAAARVPYVDDAGMIWLRDQQAGTSGVAENRHTLTVSRLISDDVPLKVVTVLDISISGDARELVLGPAVLPTAIPLALSSRLPVKLEADGRLRLQARPGRWTVEFTARFPGELAAIPLPAAHGEGWVSEEIWAFQANPLVRLAEVTGLDQIDPRQTSLPEAWHGFPAYRMGAGQEMKFEVRRRGNPEAAPNTFNLRRQLWLDFDGQGFTVADQINGLMNRDWRLNMFAPYQLGRVAINGEDQVITHLDGDRGGGVEIRQHQLQLSAESRLEERQLPGLGWDSEFGSVSGQLYLPPGWSLLSMTGVDQVSNSWIKKWTLLDIFLVLIITLAVKRLWDWRVAALALALLTLTWHEPAAPRMIWLNLVIAIALWRALPEGTPKRLINWYRWVSAAALVLLFLAFAVDAVREGLYPQLENPQSIYRSAPIAPPRAAVFMKEQLAPEAEVDVSSAPSTVYEAAKEMADAAVSSLPSEAYRRGRAEVRAKEPALMTQQVIDPGARRQTGPGLPRWQWQTIDFAWNGPVPADQAITLRLLSPTGHLLLNLLSVVLMGALTAFMLGFDLKDKRTFGFASIKGVFPLLLCAVVCAAPTPRAWAAPEQGAVIPDEALLKELERRLVKALEEPPKCAPQCAQSPRMRLMVQPDALTLHMEVHAGAEVAVPLPFEANQWLPAEVILDDKQAVGVSRIQSQYYALVPAGVHRLTLRGPLPDLASVRLPLPLNPYHIEAEATGWRVEGITDGKAAGQVQLLRQSKRASKTSAEAAYETQALPPFVIIERTVLLGIDWNVQTTVTRVSGLGDAVALEVPLLEGESVLSADAKVKNGKILLTLGAAQSSAGWSSSLSKRDTLRLKAPLTTQWLEHWRLSVSPIWRIGYQGIPEIMQQSPAGDWMPQWWPWPGEEVTVAVTRPEGIVGTTLTIDETRLHVTPGARTSETVFNMQLRSSQGEQRDLALPAGAVLQKVLIDEVEQPIQQSQNKVPLTITPGSHAITVVWRQDAGASARFTTPTLDLGLPAVNNNISVTMPQDRWILFAGGPKVGPAVLFWGVLLVILLVAFALGRTTATPLKTHHWILLGVGFSQAPVWMPALVVAWFFLLAYRARQPETVSDGRFNALQGLLVLTTVLAGSFMLYAIWQGLLGLPHMQIVGNGSWEYELNWYQDRAEGTLPSAWVVSVPIFVYRMLMLAWALWLAFALLNWVQWGWRCYSSNGLWRKVKVPAIKKKGGRAEQKKDEEIIEEIDIDPPANE